MKIFILFSILLFFNVNLTLAQSQGAFGFTGSKTPLSGNLFLVKDGTNMISTNSGHVYFVSNDNRIYDIFWTPNNGWSPALVPLGGMNCPTVKMGTKITNYGDEIYFVAANNSKIYQLKWNSISGWQSRILVPNQVPVSGNKINLKANIGGCEIYYIGVNGKICQLYYNGNVNVIWTGGIQLSWIQTMDAITTSDLIVTDVHVYYVGLNRKIYEMLWVTGSGWTGGNTPLLWQAADLVKSGTNLTNYGNHLFFINDNSKICDLLWNSTTGWEWSVLSNFSNVRQGTSMICFDNNIFYVNSFDNKIWRLWQVTPTTWNNAVIQVDASPFIPAVKINTEIFVWANEIIEEGTLNTKFKSYHIFYAGNDLKLNMLVYDDKHVEFKPFGCFDPCDNNHNNTGWDNPQNGITSPVPGYDCGQQRVNGINIKGWYYGQVPTGNSNYYPQLNKIMVVTNKHFFYVNENNGKIYDFLRTQVNGTTKDGYTPAWSDEFNGTTLDALKWANSFNGWNHNPTVCYDLFWNDPSNVVEQNGIVSIKVKNPTIPFTGTQTVWVGVGAASCFNSASGFLTYTKDYNFTTGVISSHHNISEGQYIEGRFKIPRGNRLWTGFWFPYGGGTAGQEDINFEFEGNGKALLLTMYDIVWNPGLINYSVGYRYYDDYYTYGVKWETDYISYYVNNELMGRIVNRGNHCKTPREIILNVELADSNIHAACEPPIFPTSFDIDYVRTWDRIH